MAREQSRLGWGAGSGCIRVEPRKEFLSVEPLNHLTEVKQRNLGIQPKYEMQNPHANQQMLLFLSRGLRLFSYQNGNPAGGGQRTWLRQGSGKNPDWTGPLWAGRGLPLLQWFGTDHPHGTAEGWFSEPQRRGVSS